MKLILITLVALVVGMMALACTTTSNIDAKVEAAISATKTAEEGEPNLTLEMMEGILAQYWIAGKEAGYPERGFLNGAACLSDGELSMHNRMWDFKKTFDPQKKEWEIQATGRYCRGIEFFYINDVTGKLSR